MEYPVTVEVFEAKAELHEYGPYLLLWDGRVGLLMAGYHAPKVSSVRQVRHYVERVVLHE